MYVCSRDGTRDSGETFGMTVRNRRGLLGAWEVEVSLVLVLVSLPAVGRALWPTRGTFGRIWDWNCD